eukprot:7215289-Prymnesium_polylepis.1
MSGGTRISSEGSTNNDCNWPRQSAAAHSTAWGTVVMKSLARGNCHHLGSPEVNMTNPTVLKSP